LKIREEVPSPPVACHVLSFKDDFVAAGSHLPVFYAICHNDHVIGKKELIFRPLDKELLGNIILEKVILIVVLDQGVIGHGHFGLIIDTVVFH
jgi:hypothetical protein